MINTSQHSYVTLLTPILTPRVLYLPVVLPILCSIADHCYSMICFILVTVCVKNATTVIVPSLPCIYGGDGSSLFSHHLLQKILISVVSVFHIRNSGAPVVGFQVGWTAIS